MLSFMDWSIVAMGCASVLTGLGARWSARAEAQEREDRTARLHWSRLALLMGAVLILAKAPQLLDAPYLAVEIADAVDLGLSIAALAFALRGARYVRAGSRRGLSGPHGAGRD